MKPKRRILSLLLAICLVEGVIPTMAFALDGSKTIMLKTNGIKDPTEHTDDKGKYYTPNSYIYFGMNQSDPIKWRVLDADKTNSNSTDGMFLFSEYLLESGIRFEDAWDIDDGDGQENPNAWQDSDAQKWCKKFASNPSNFSTAEQNAMLGVKKTDSAEHLYIINWGESSLTDADKMFFLSARELADCVGNYDHAPGLAAAFSSGNTGEWWLRSSVAGYENNAGAVEPDGFVFSSCVSHVRAARPAFNLELNAVLFTSAAEGGKSSGAAGADALKAVDDYSGNEWKLTLLDSSRNFDVTESTASGKPNDTIMLNYSGATIGKNEYISVIITDKGGAQYYGRIAKPTSKSGTVSLKIPNTLADGTYTLYVFSEQYNGDVGDGTEPTDYASAFEKVTLTIDTAAPTLNNGRATRDSDTTATVTFTSSEAGKYYYSGVESGAPAPTIAPPERELPASAARIPSLLRPFRGRAQRIFTLW